MEFKNTKKTYYIIRYVDTANVVYSWDDSDDYIEMKAEAVRLKGLHPEMRVFIDKKTVEHQYEEIT